MHKAGNTTHNNRQHPAGIPRAQHTPMCPGTNRKLQCAGCTIQAGIATGIATRTAHKQPLLMLRVHPKPDPDTKHPDVNGEKHRWTTANHTQEPQTAHPTVHNPWTSRRQTRKAAWGCMHAS